MNDDNSRKPDPREGDLDRMLDLLVPPAPSETLRARLLRDFAPDAAAASARPGGQPAHSRFGMWAVAAALVLAVALGIVMPPRGQPVRGLAAAPAAVADLGAATDSEEDLLVAFDARFGDAGESGVSDAARALNDDAPDGAVFMVAALNLALEGANGNGPAPDGAEPFDGMPLE